MRIAARLKFPVLVSGTLFAAPLLLALSLSLLPGNPGGASADSSSKRSMKNVSALAGVMALAPKAKSTVLVFMGTNCPISNRYAPEIAAIARGVKGKNASVILVYANAGITKAKATQHAKEYGLAGLPILMDPLQTVADTVGATVTPEAVVLDASHAVRYRGRIDNQNSQRASSSRPGGATSPDLRRAIGAVLAGKVVVSSRLPAVGCTIERAAPVRTATGTPTYSHDIAPILNRNCVSCHRSGEIGPMPLGTYADAKQFATNIAGVTAAKQMPPWKPVGMSGVFHSERTLTDAQIKILSDWANGGAPAGNLKQLAPPPRYASGWKLGKPDLVLTMPASYAIPASGPDIYRCFVIPTGLSEDKQVVAVEYRVGNTSVAHHCIGYLDTTDAARKKDAEEVGEGYTSFGGPGILPTGEIGGWAPGNMPQFLPEGTGKPLAAGSDLVLQMHYHPNGKPETDRTTVGVYFAKKPVTKRVYTLPILAQLDIPAGKPNYQTSRTFTLPLNAEVISVTPHMHLLGKKFSMVANLPGGSAKTLISIDDWDFNWQDTYTYKKPLLLPKGTTVTLKATYDNSASNPRNPSSPPKTVGWGEQTTDEMCVGIISFVTDDQDSGLLRLLDLGRGRRTVSRAN